MRPKHNELALITPEDPAGRIPELLRNFDARLNARLEDTLLTPELPMPILFDMLAHLDSLPRKLREKGKQAPEIARTMKYEMRALTEMVEQAARPGWKVNITQHLLVGIHSFSFSPQEVQDEPIILRDQAGRAVDALTSLGDRRKKVVRISPRVTTIVDKDTFELSLHHETEGQDNWLSIEQTASNIFGLPARIMMIADTVSNGNFKYIRLVKSDQTENPYSADRLPNGLTAGNAETLGNTMNYNANGTMNNIICHFDGRRPTGQTYIIIPPEYGDEFTIKSAHIPPEFIDESMTSLEQLRDSGVTLTKEDDRILVGRDGTIHEFPLRIDVPGTLAQIEKIALKQFPFNIVFAKELKR